MRKKIFEQIELERQEQDAKWGGSKHDDAHTNHDWVAFIIRHLGRAVIWPFSWHTFRFQMVRVAALAVAAIEWVDRNRKDAPAKPWMSKN
jgi:hypothetical protein